MTFLNGDRQLTKRIEAGRLSFVYDLARLQFHDTVRALLHELVPEAPGPDTAFLSFLDRAMPNGLPTTLVASNAQDTPDARPEWRKLLFRPYFGGPHGARFGSGGRTVGVRAFRRQGKLIVDGVEVTPHVPERGFEALVSGPIYWNHEDCFISSEDFELLGRLPSRRAKSAQRLAAWRDYLSWKEKLLRTRQIRFPYLAWMAQDENHWAFLVEPASMPPGRLSGVELCATVLPSTSDSESQPKKPKTREPDAPLVGEVQSIIHLPKKGPGRPHELAVFEFEGEAKIVVVRLDEERAAQMRKKGVPPTGILESSIVGDLASLSVQRIGIDRLQRNQGYCENLEDFLFESRNAGAPVVLPELAVLPGGRELNDGQRDAVRKAMAAPELCLIQGPPGTGKTTVIAEICLRTALAGGRVLVASQTNLAVDNALSRLANVPAVRRLRLGDPGRVDEEFKDFLEDHVVEHWFRTIGDHCRRRTQAAATLFELHVARQTAVDDLRRVWSQAHVVAADVTETRARVEAARVAAGLARERLEGARAEAVTRSRLAEGWAALTSWALGSASLSATTLEGNLLTAEENSQVQAIERARHKLEPLHNLHACLCSLTASGSGTEAASLELRQLRVDQRRLAESVDDDDLAKLKATNRRIQELERDGWNRTTGEIGRLARRAFEPIEMPDSLALLADALKPSAESDGWVKDAQGRVEVALSGARAAEQEAQEWAQRWSPKAVTAQQVAARASEMVQAATAEAESGRRALDAATAEQVEAERQQEAAVEAWRDAWQRAMPEDAPTAPDDMALHRAQGVADGLGCATRILQEREQRWGPLRRDWQQRLANAEESDRDHLRGLYRRHANVVGMTCNEAGKKSTWNVEGFKPFDVVIVDEVSKATPTELILPLLLGRKAVIVGDHRQLPPMFRERAESTWGETEDAGDVTSEDLERYRKLVTAGLFQELFEEAPESIRSTLWTQYRMHPHIMAAVNQFYDGRLEAGPSETALAKQREHGLAIKRRGDELLRADQHLLWIDSSSDSKGQPAWEEQRGSSKANQLEIDLVVATLRELGAALSKRGYIGLVDREIPDGAVARPAIEWARTVLPEAPDETIEDLLRNRRVRVGGRAVDRDTVVAAGMRFTVAAQKDVGVITFYSAQLKAIRAALDKAASRSPGVFASMELRKNTVDRFQGMEKQIIVASLVRSTRQRLSGFVREYQRINVALSRAQELLVVIGAADTWRRALVSLPPVDGGETREAAVYSEILDIADRCGGRRHARQFL